jgi:hypothetical protein
VRVQPFNRHYARLAIPAGIAAAVMVAVHLGLRHGGWPADLAATAIVGTVAYVIGLVTLGLTPTERSAMGRVAGLLRSRAS